MQVAIESGRLSKSLTPDRKQIADIEAADLEWAGSTHSDRVPISSSTPSAATETGSATPLQEHRARRGAAEAELAEIELAEKRRELLPAKDIESRLVNVFAGCKTKLLGIASRARQRDPSLSGAQVTMIESLVREALEDLASGGDA